MAAALSLIPELDDIVRNGSVEKRAEAVERISSLFLQGAAHFETRHVALFDDILIGLVPATEVANNDSVVGDREATMPPGNLGDVDPDVRFGVAADQDHGALDEDRKGGPFFQRDESGRHASTFSGPWALASEGGSGAEPEGSAIGCEPDAATDSRFSGPAFPGPIPSRITLI